ncbi:hypothetical protein NDU88_002607 [Pleurodeles waltl]|uniref:Uncharacterized protein n=1 Tax=Pleurodeles waltl TaxID=8319 RepID=A0AAV7QAC9_PLEWA|nr:hypothetical protein NDU88_002607 [Pleurodeles waltl]
MENRPVRHCSRGPRTQRAQLGPPWDSGQAEVTLAFHEVCRSNPHLPRNLRCRSRPVPGAGRPLTRINERIGSPAQQSLTDGECLGFLLSVHVGFHILERTAQDFKREILRKASAAKSEDLTIVLD